MSIIDKHGRLMSKFVNSEFSACLFSSQSSVVFVLWRHYDDCHFKCKRINVGILLNSYLKCIKTYFPSMFA